MSGEKKLFVLAAALAVLGVTLLAGGGAAQPDPDPQKCDPAALVPCSCVQIGPNTVCHDPNQAIQLVWCSPNGNAPCVANQIINCPGNGKEGTGTCTAGFVPGNNPCLNTPMNSC